METLLILIVAVLGVLAIAQAVRVFELSSNIKGSDSDVNVTDKDNKTQGLLLLIFLFLFFGSFAWMVVEWDSVMLPVAASLHGLEIDSLWAISMGVIIVAFLITQPLLFGFSYLFRGSKKRKAVYMEHNNKLELFWTGVPAVVLAGLILYGLTTWSAIMNPTNDKEPLVVELYAKQFGWQARYAGGDNQLGYANVRLIEGVNTLGVDADDINSLDDVVTSELHLPKDQPVLFKFRSQDVIHSAFLPHFRVQMNCVPGSKTQFQFIPNKTTAEMRTEPDVVEKVKSINEIRAARGDDPWEFDYVLMCNKICGSAHYNMQMKVVVETQEEFDKWMKEQKSFAETL
jgi:cytochrome c oxidase subunit 2